nr:hypothetical protein Itr_chr09CG06100 [Ipomoea trifida]
MAGEEQHNLREVPPDAAAHHRLHNPCGFAHRFHRRVLPRCMGAVVVPLRRAAHRTRASGVHHLRVRRRQPRRRCRRPRQGVQRVPPREIFAVAQG